MITRIPAKIRPSRRGEHYLRLSWVCVALLPVAFVMGMVVGEGLISLLGYEPSLETVPLWAAVAAGTPALLILVAPGVAAVFYGRRAQRAGRAAGTLPAWIGGCVAALVVAQNVMALILSR
jgi:non-ribosomal peptide synthetase component F